MFVNYGNLHKKKVLLTLIKSLENKQNIKAAKKNSEETVWLPIKKLNYAQKLILSTREKNRYLSFATNTNVIDLKIKYVLR